MADSKPLAVYDEKAADHAALFQASGLSRSLRDFLARRADLPRLLGALVAAMKPAGVLYIGMKAANGEARDGLGRFCAYVSPAELTALLTDQVLKVLWTEAGREVGLAGTDDGFVLMRAEKPHHG